jgi:asparagine synthase (glutamine-hydrolysing)
MSVQFGVLRNDTQRVEDEQLLALGTATNRYAPIGCVVQGGAGVGIGFQPYHTHQRSELEAQPLSDPRGSRLTFDGRLDNYRELAALLNLPANTPDSNIVLASFERWGEECFAKLIGDWALALWSANESALYLARDHAGTRSLYFEQTNDCLLWSTFLETFFVGGIKRSLDETYVVNYLACRPLQGRTPYAGICMVPAAHYLKFRKGIIARVAHWQWMVRETIHYKRDAEYEEHFFSLFRQSVERRTGPGTPILAQLSGGMDSSSIVCMSDYIRSEGRQSRSDLLDTISFYDEREPELDEIPFVRAVERQRGREGIHMESSHAERTFLAVDSSQAWYLLPGADSSSPGREQRLRKAIGSDKYRVMLSGTGGDEVMGGVPTPLPELGDYLVSGAVERLLPKSVAWCLPKRQPLILMLRDVVEYLIRVYRVSADDVASRPAWVNLRLPGGDVLQTDSRRPWVRPSRIENGRTWWMIQETLPHLYPSYITRYEYRYPFLDRDLVDFLFRIPREQLLRPGQKRSLQRRSLKALLPDEVFSRNRKAFASRGISLALRSLEPNLNSLMSSSIAVEKGIVNEECYTSAFCDYANGIGGTNAIGLMRLLHFESWVVSSLSNGYVAMN